MGHAPGINSICCAIDGHNFYDFDEGAVAHTGEVSGGRGERRPACGVEGRTGYGSVGLCSHRDPVIIFDIAYAGKGIHRQGELTLSRSGEGLGGDGQAAKELGPTGADLHILSGHSECVGGVIDLGCIHSSVRGDPGHGQAAKLVGGAIHHNGHGDGLALRRRALVGGNGTNAAAAVHGDRVAGNGTPGAIGNGDLRILAGQGRDGLSHADIVSAGGQASDDRAGAGRVTAVRSGLPLHGGGDAGDFAVAAACVGGRDALQTGGFSRFGGADGDGVAIAQPGSQTIAGDHIACVDRQRRVGHGGDRLVFGQVQGAFGIVIRAGGGGRQLQDSVRLHADRDRLGDLQADVAGRAHIQVEGLCAQSIGGDGDVAGGDRDGRIGGAARSDERCCVVTGVAIGAFMNGVLDRAAGGDGQCGVLVAGGGAFFDHRVAVVIGGDGGGEGILVHGHHDGDSILALDISAGRSCAEAKRIIVKGRFGRAADENGVGQRGIHGKDGSGFRNGVFILTSIGIFPLDGSGRLAVSGDVGDAILDADGGRADGGFVRQAAVAGISGNSDFFSRSQLHCAGRQDAHDTVTVGCEQDLRAVRDRPEVAIGEYIRLPGDLQGRGVAADCGDLRHAFSIDIQGDRTAVSGGGVGVVNAARERDGAVAAGGKCRRIQHNFRRRTQSDGGVFVCHARGGVEGRKCAVSGEVHLRLQHARDILCARNVAELRIGAAHAVGAVNAVAGLGQGDVHAAAVNRQKHHIRVDIVGRAVLRLEQDAAAVDDGRLAQVADRAAVQGDLGLGRVLVVGQFAVRTQSDGRSAALAEEDVAGVRFHMAVHQGDIAGGVNGDLAGVGKGQRDAVLGGDKGAADGGVATFCLEIHIDDFSTRDVRLNFPAVDGDGAVCVVIPVHINNLHMALHQRKVVAVRRVLHALNDRSTRRDGEA